MKEQFVPHEIALKLKEKGFIEECMASYEISLTKQAEVIFNKGHFVNYAAYCDFTNNSRLHCAAPLWQQVEDWLAEKHSIDILIRPFYDADGRLYSAMYFLKSDGTLVSDDANTFMMLGEFDTKQEARRAAVLHALTVIE